MRFNQKIAVLLLLIFASSACKKSSTTCSIPSVFVDFTIYITSPEFYKLNAIGGWVYVTGGVRGIIIYKQSVDQYLAYDRNCTYQSSNASATVQVDTTNNIIAIDPSCGSKFSLYDGGVLKAPATCGLKQYTAVLSGTALHVYGQ